MITLVRFLLIVCLVLRSNSTNVSDLHVTQAESFDGRYQPIDDAIKSDSDSLDPTTSATVSDKVGRSFDLLDNHYLQVEAITKREQQHQSFQKKAKPIRNIYMGIYKNYKSTYLGNRTSMEYRKTLKDRTATATTATSHAGTTLDESLTTNGSTEELHDSDLSDLITEQALTSFEAESIKVPVDSTSKQKIKQNIKKSKKKKRKNKSKHKGKNGAVIPKPPAGGDDPLIYSHNGEYRYNIGPGLNMSLDMNNDIVSVNLDERSLKDVFLSRWSDSSDEGRGKKQELISKVLPLFIIPFLIQSAIIPFLVTKLKLLLVKSILVGKLAIFLLVISALKNSSKSTQTYEVAPSYWGGEPSRRSEPVAAAASPYSGYRVEGRPTTWVNR